MHASVSALLLTTEAVVADKPEPVHRLYDGSINGHGRYDVK